MFRQAIAEHLDPGEVCLQLAPSFDIAQKPELLRALVRVPGVISATVEGFIAVVVVRTASHARDEAFHAELLAAAGGQSSIIGVCKQGVTVAESVAADDGESAAAGEGVLGSKAEYLDG